MYDYRTWKTSSSQMLVQILLSIFALKRVPNYMLLLLLMKLVSNLDGNALNIMQKKKSNPTLLCKLPSFPIFQI